MIVGEYWYLNIFDFVKYMYIVKKYIVKKIVGKKCLLYNLLIEIKVFG